MYVGSNRRHITSEAKLIGYSITNYTHFAITLHMLFINTWYGTKSKNSFSTLIYYLILAAYVMVCQDSMNSVRDSSIICCYSKLPSLM